MNTMQDLPRISPDALTAHLDDETVILHLGTKQYYHLNTSGQRIWELLEDGMSEASLVQRLCEEFEVSADTALLEIRALFDTLRQYGLIEDHAIPSIG